MIVNIELSHGAYKYFKFVLFLYRRRKLVIKTVYTFYYHYFIGFKAYILALILPHSCYKIIAWKFNGFTLDKVVNILIELLYINAAYIFIIPFAKFINRSFVPVNKVVVHRNYMWPNS